MVDAVLVAVLDGIEDLDEDVLEELVVAGVQAALNEGMEEVAARAVLQNDVEELLGLVIAVEAADVWVVGDLHMRTELALLELPELGVLGRLLHDLDGV